MQVTKRLPLIVFRYHTAYISSYKTVKLLKKPTRIPILSIYLHGDKYPLELLPVHIFSILDI